ncbi:MAG: hypothetical protein ACJAS9_000380 [Polaribacter sp.]|jgi:hypothetical protein
MRFSFLLVFLLTFFLSSCIITPKIKRGFDPICVQFRNIVKLQSKFIVTNCSRNQDCRGLIGVSLITVAITGAISVAILSVGNVYYAIEHKSQCKVKVKSDKIKLPIVPIV